MTPPSHGGNREFKSRPVHLTQDFLTSLHSYLSMAERFVSNDDNFGSFLWVLRTELGEKLYSTGGKKARVNEQGRVEFRIASDSSLEEKLESIVGKELNINLEDGRAYTGFPDGSKLFTCELEDYWFLGMQDLEPSKKSDQAHKSRLVYRTVWRFR